MTKNFFLGHWIKKFRAESNFQLSGPVFHKIYLILYEILMEFDRWILDWWYFSKKSKKSLNQFFTHSGASGGNHPTVHWLIFTQNFFYVKSIHFNFKLDLFCMHNLISFDNFRIEYWKLITKHRKWICNCKVPEKI